MILNLDMNNLKLFHNPISIYDMHKLNKKSYSVCCGIFQRLKDYGFIALYDEYDITKVALNVKYSLTQKGLELLKVFNY